VAGRTLEQDLNPLPDQKAEFIWSGLDYLGRPVDGTTTAHISIGFVYDAVYYRAGGVAQAFGQAGDEVTGVRARQEVTSWKCSEIIIDSLKGKGKGVLAEGWTLSSHHHLDPKDYSKLYKGDGTVTANNTNIITTVAGNGSEGYSGDGGPATEANLCYPYDIAVDAAGNIFIADLWNHCIRKVDASGVITTVAGTGTSGYSGDGALATEAQLYYPNGIAVDAAGNIFIADYYNSRIRKVDASGIITTMAGTGYGGYSGDGGLATEAQLGHPYDVAVDAAGNIFIADYYNSRIRKVDTRGIITTVAGNGYGSYSGDGGLATKARLSYLHDVAVDAAGNIFIADYGNNRIRKVDASGIITTVAGTGTSGYSGDGGPATEARLNYPDGIAVDAAGNIFIADYGNNRIREVDTSGIITTVAGNGYGSYSGDGGPAIEAWLDCPNGVAVDVAGNIFIADNWNNRIRKVSSPSAFAGAITSGGIPFAEENGLGHIMSHAGLHKTTIDLDTGITLYEFGYDQDDNLVSITDLFGNQTTINYYGCVPSSIVSPDGITTTFTIDADNHLTRIAYPDGSKYSFEYTLDGLMTAEIEPEGNRFEHDFGTNGRLTDVFDEQGGHWNYARTAYENGDILTKVTTGEGNLTSYLDHNYSTGKYTSTITDPTGAETLYTQSADGLSVNKSLSCGMELAFKYDVDSEYRFKYVKEMSESAPSTLEKVTLREKSYQDTDSDDIPDLITETVTVNGNTTTLENNTLQSQKTIASPEGRTVTTHYDSSNLMTTSLSIPGLYDTTYGYDARGRLTSIGARTRETFFAYDAQGFLSSITDPENQTISYTYDPVGRMTWISRPDGSSVGFAYDQNGNMTLLTNPSDIDHGFGYNTVNLKNSYRTPLSGSYSYIYDKDRRLIHTNFPSGSQIKNIYNKIRLVQIQIPEGNIDLSYLCGTKLGSITNGTDTITYEYDGKLVTSETLTGTLNQSLIYSCNDDFNVQDLTYAGKTHNLHL
jgi:YD repeat-containing protein